MIRNTILSLGRERRSHAGVDQVDRGSANGLPAELVEADEGLRVAFALQTQEDLVVRRATAVATV
jgi:hypothetical protein